MDSKDIIKTEKQIEKLNIIKSKNKFINIKSDYFIQKVFGIIQKRISLEIIKYNINIQKRLNININNYKEFSELYSSIELEIIPIQNKYGSFINIDKEEDKIYFHIYFNDNKEEIKKTEIDEEDKVSKINIIIDYQIKSFFRLFSICECIESINFKKFYRNNITNMKCMFYGCSFLKEINLSNFNTNNVTDMSYMFSDCSSLKKINLSNFNTNNVTNMASMFDGCSSLKELNLSNFNTNNVIYMSYLFHKCSSLKELKLSNFNTNNVTNMSYMFSKCSNELKMKIRSEYKNFDEIAFDDYNDSDNSDDN